MGLLDLLILHLIVAGLSVPIGCFFHEYPYSLDYYDMIYTDEEAPDFMVEPQHIVAKEGETVTIPCKINGSLRWFLLVTVSKIDTVTQKSRLLYAGWSRVSKSSRYRKTDGNMKIFNIRSSDSGTYICRIEGNSVKEVRHTLDVQYPPRLRVYPSKVRVLSGENAWFWCLDTGNPKPIIYWSYLDGELPFRAYQDKISPLGAQQDENQTSLFHQEGDLPPTTQHEWYLPSGTRQEGLKLFLKGVDDQMIGTYTCNAHNGIGDTTTVPVSVVIDYPPEIIGEKGIIFGKRGHHVELTCIVHAEPAAKVIWTKNGEPIIMRSRVEERRGHRYHILGIYYIPHSTERRYDMEYSGNYMCTAFNTRGNATASINITKLVTALRFTSDPHGDEKDRYTLTWQAESYYPITSMTVTYRKATVDNNTGEMRSWTWIESSLGFRFQGLVYTMKKTLTLLAPATEYQVVLRVSNIFNWSDWSNFTFFTKGTLEANSTAGTLEVNSKAVAACPISLVMLPVLMLLFRDRIAP